jgi:hypothetical protein
MSLSQLRMAKAKLEIRIQFIEEGLAQKKDPHERAIIQRNLDQAHNELNKVTLEMLNHGLSQRLLKLLQGPQPSDFYIEEENDNNTNEVPSMLDPRIDKLTKRLQVVRLLQRLNHLNRSEESKIKNKKEIETILKKLEA